MMLLAWTACAEAADTLPFRFERVAEVEHPTAIVARDGAVWMTEQDGRVWRLHGGSLTCVLDLRKRIASGGETGLLGLAPAPSFPRDPRVFVNYTVRLDGKLHTRVASYRWSGAALDPASEVEVLSFRQPYANHNAGALAFGADGMLYVAVGDGGSGGDPHGYAQNRSEWLGSLLRIDVSRAPYAVPADNPFVGQAGVAPEIWAYGVRNPWGMHFDGATMYFADVGQDAWEEVNRGVAGGNYGWNVREGNACYKASSCRSTGLVPPLAVYGHDRGQSVTGGNVYRGPSIPALDGRYVYADFVTGVFWALDTAGGAPVLLGDTDLYPSAFGRDLDGGLLVGDYRGTVWRIRPPSSGAR
jgi:glucose/arabinose dehydrogenase